MVSMKPIKTRRTGATETFSVSVDANTKRALRALADQDFGGNLSALVTDMAEEARRRLAAGAYLRKRRIPKLELGEARVLEAEIDREIAPRAEHVASDAPHDADLRARHGSADPRHVPRAAPDTSHLLPTDPCDRLLEMLSHASCSRSAPPSRCACALTPRSISASPRSSRAEEPPPRWPGAERASERELDGAAKARDAEVTAECARDALVRSSHVRLGRRGAIELDRRDGSRRPYPDPNVEMAPGWQAVLDRRRCGGGGPIELRPRGGGWPCVPAGGAVARVSRDDGSARQNLAGPFGT